MKEKVSVLLHGFDARKTDLDMDSNCSATATLINSAADRDRRQTRRIKLAVSPHRWLVT